MIVLWIISMVCVAVYTFAVSQTDLSSEDGKEGIGVIKWLIIASLVLVLFVQVFMGVKLWLTN